jgi:mannitol-1-phosphate 5-dehydrogenase
MTSPSPGSSAAGAVIIGAGRTGRGLAGVLCQRSQLPFVLVDQDPRLVASLATAGEYAVHVLGAHPPEVLRLRPQACYHSSDPRWIEAAVSARVIMTSVFGNHLGELAGALAEIIRQRHQRHRGPLDIITCENLTHAARVLRVAVERALAGSGVSLSACPVGFVEAMVLTTSLAAAPGADPLSVRTQNAFRLPCDGDALIAGDPGINGLEPLAHFENQLRRKIYTYNGINAVISYLGAQRGHLELASATRDPEITPWAILAGQEASAALVAEYGFPVQEQERWQADALAKFADQDIPDPIARNAADPARKLSAEDRLVGPALLALSHRQTPRALVRGIIAAAHYRSTERPGESGAEEASLLERHGSLAAVLMATARLPADHPLVALVEAEASALARAGLSHATGVTIANPAP